MATEEEMVETLADNTVEMLDRQHGEDLVKEANRVARQYGIDGRYVQSMLNQDSNNWPKLPGRQREALLAMTSMTREGLHFKDTGFSIPDYDDEDKIDSAIVDLGQWAWDHRRQIRLNYFREIHKLLPVVKGHLARTTTRNWSDRDAMVWLHAALKDRVKTDPAGIWRATMLWRILDLLL